MTRFLLNISLWSALPVLAHPGHGKSELFHLHDAAELTPWLLLVVMILGLACWKLLRKP